MNLAQRSTCLAKITRHLIPLQPAIAKYIAQRFAIHKFHCQIGCASGRCSMPENADYADVINLL